jgi:hypothetical protein
LSIDPIPLTPFPWRGRGKYLIKRGFAPNPALLLGVSKRVINPFWAGGWEERPGDECPKVLNNYS